MSSPSGKLPGEGGEVTESEAMSPAQNLVPGPFQCPPDATIQLFSEGACLTVIGEIIVEQIPGVTM